MQHSADREMLGCQQCATCESSTWKGNYMALNNSEELYAVLLEVLGIVVGEAAESSGDTAIASVCRGRDITRLRAPVLLHSVPAIKAKIYFPINVQL